MNINIYEMYDVIYTNESIRLSEENETKYDNIFVKEKYKDNLEINGGRLLEIIAEKLQDPYLSEFVIVGKELHFEIFNYNNGEHQSICYTILGSEIMGAVD